MRKVRLPEPAGSVSPLSLGAKTRYTNNMKNENAAAPKMTKYYVGDLCYVLDNSDWNEVCDLTPFDNSEMAFELSDGRQFWLGSTAYGDGTYNDDEGRPYSVDSGTLGAIRVDDISDQDKFDETIKNGLGQVVDMPVEPGEFEVEADGGTLYFHLVRIETEGTYEDDDEVDIEEEDEDEDA